MVIIQLSQSSTNHTGICKNSSCCVLKTCVLCYIYASKNASQINILRLHDSITNGVTNACDNKHTILLKKKFCLFILCWSLGFKVIYIGLKREYGIGGRSWTWNQTDPRFRFQFPQLRVIGDCSLWALVSYPEKGG